MSNLFTKHPHSLGETYWCHMKFAWQFGSSMFLGGCACLIHAVFPFLFEKTGSNFLFKLVHDFVERMPRVENRVVMLSERIEQKIAEQPDQA